MPARAGLWIALAALVSARPVSAQVGPPAPQRSAQRPLGAIDVRLVEPGWILVETGGGYERDRDLPASGLRGDVLRVPDLTVRVGMARRVELRVDTGYAVLLVRRRGLGPLSTVVDYEGEYSSDIRDPVVATIVRLRGEKPGWPAVGLRLATRLPVASNESGLGLDTTDFFATLLLAKDAGPLRWVANAGVGILEVPTTATSQNDVVTYALSVSRRMSPSFELAAGVDGHMDLSGQVHPGTEDTGILRLGGRWDRGGSRLDAALLLGLAEVDPPIGFTIGVTRAFRMFAED